MRLDGAAQASHFVQAVSRRAPGQTVIRFPNPKSTGVISVMRMDAGEVMVGYEIS